MDVNRPAAELVVDVVNASNSGALDQTWAADLLTRDRLPIWHRRAVEAGQVDSALGSLQALATETKPIFAAPNQGIAVERVNDALASVNVRVTVSLFNPAAPHLHYDAHGDDIGQRLRVNGLVALAIVLADPAGAMRVGVCASTCAQVFVDFGRAGRQRFCSRRCATRSHVSEYRRRQAAFS